MSEQLSGFPQSSVHPRPTVLSDSAPQCAYPPNISSCCSRPLPPPPHPHPLRLCRLLSLLALQGRPLCIKPLFCYIAYVLIIVICFLKLIRDEVFDHSNIWAGLQVRAPHPTQGTTHPVTCFGWSSYLCSLLAVAALLVARY